MEYSNIKDKVAFFQAFINQGSESPPQKLDLSDVIIKKSIKETTTKSSDDTKTKTLDQHGDSVLLVQKNVPGQLVPLPVEPDSGKLWSNKCAGCSNVAIDSIHSGTECCVVCRNFERIDIAAQETSLEWLKKFKLGQETFGEKLAEEVFRKRDVEKSCKNIETAIKVLTDQFNKLCERLEAANTIHHPLIEKANNLITQRADATIINAAVAEANKAQILPNELTETLNSLGVKIAEEKNNLTLAKNGVAQIDNTCQELTKGIAQFLLRENNLTKADNIARARFFFTWIAVSLTYNSAVSHLFLAERTDADTILNGSEVCHGFSSLFVTMFNATQKPGWPLAVYLNGIDKQNSGVIAEPKNEATHAWNAFPLTNDAQKLQYKLIDVTWGSGAVNNVSGRKEIRPEWFYATPEYFIHTHWPAPYNNQQFKTYIEEANLHQNAQLLPSELVLSKQQFLAQVHKEYFQVKSLPKCNFALGTVKPDEERLLGNKDAEIGFDRCCQHSTLGADGMYAIPAKDNTVDLASGVPFISNGRGQWSATVKKEALEGKDRLKIVILSDEQEKLITYEALKERRTANIQIETLTEWKL